MSNLGTFWGGVFFAFFLCLFLPHIWNLVMGLRGVIFVLGFAQEASC
jgi:hypothetical protein